MDMIGHSIDTKQFLLLISDNARNVFEDLVFECLFDEILSPFYGEYYMDGDLGICIVHFIVIPLPIYRPAGASDGMIYLSTATDISSRWG